MVVRGIGGFPVQLVLLCCWRIIENGLIFAVKLAMLTVEKA